MQVALKAAGKNASTTGRPRVLLKRDGLTILVHQGEVWRRGANVYSHGISERG